MKDDMKRTNAELKSTTDKLGEDASADEANPHPVTPNQLRLLMLSYVWNYVANLAKLDAAENKTVETAHT